MPALILGWGLNLCISALMGNPSWHPLGCSTATLYLYRDFTHLPFLCLYLQRRGLHSRKDGIVKGWHSRKSTGSGIKVGLESHLCNWFAICNYRWFFKKSLWSSFSPSINWACHLPDSHNYHKGPYAHILPGSSLIWMNKESAAQ